MMKISVTRHLFVWKKPRVLVCGKDRGLCAFGYGDRLQEREGKKGAGEGTVYVC